MKGKSARIARKTPLTPRPIKRRKPIKKSTQRRLRGTTAIPKSLLKKADEIFSITIRKRDKRCFFPGCDKTTNLQCSHYIGRATKSTRFDPDNCISLCWYHHYGSKRKGWEYQKQTIEEDGWDGQYTLFMRGHLGAKRFNALMSRAKQKTRLTKDSLATLITTLKSGGN